MSVNSVQFLHVSFQEWVIKSLYPANYTVNWQFTDKNNQPKFARWSRLTWLHLCLLSCKSQCCILSTGWSLFRYSRCHAYLTPGTTNAGEHVIPNFCLNNGKILSNTLHLASYCLAIANKKSWKIKYVVMSTYPISRFSSLNW